MIHRPSCDTCANEQLRSGTKLATSLDGELRIIDAASSQVEHAFQLAAARRATDAPPSQGDQDRLSAAAAFRHPPDDVCAAAWDASGTKLAATFVRAGAFSPDATSEGVLKRALNHLSEIMIFDTKSGGAQVMEIGAPAHSLAWSPSGLKLAIYGGGTADGGTLHIVDVPRSVVEHQVRGTGTVKLAAWDPSGTTLATGWDDVSPSGKSSYLFLL